MATGLIALLDDIAAIAKVAAASLDDTAAAAAKASAKAAGVVIDDAAVTPRYVTGFTADRELPIVGKIALGSFKNKLLILLPGALALSYFAPWAITPLLMAGGAYLCFEGAEKLYEVFVPHAEVEGPAAAADPAATEKLMISGAIRTDLILSAEIMALTLASVGEMDLVNQAIVLAIVGIGITILVYGAVALIVRADDVGMSLARSGTGLLRGIGRGLVTGMPYFLKGLGYLGTAAMLWVGGGIIVHGLETYGVAEPGHSIHALAERVGDVAGGFGEWLVGALGSGIVGLAVGAAVVMVFKLVRPARATH